MDSAGKLTSLVPESTALLQNGTVVEDRYVIETLAETGGMGRVYRGHDRESGRAVAVKVLRRTPAFDATRVHGEAEMLQQLEDPGIVRYISHGTTRDGQFYLVMEWLEGEPLSRIVRRGRLSIEQALGVAGSTARALAAAHARGIIHRDVKPSNLMLVDSASSRVKLLDFGIARSVELSSYGRAVGTPGYLAPEQARGGRRYDARVDVFSLGCVLFECITGRPAFVADDMLALMAKIVIEDPPPLAELRPEAPPALCELVRCMLAKEPSDRPADAHAVLAEIRLIASVQGVGRRSTPPPSQLAGAALTHHEQSVVSVVLAAEAEQTLVDDDDSGEFPVSLEGTLAPFGGELKRLAGGSLACVFAGAVANDLAARAARASLILSATRPDAPVVVATGRAVTGGRLPVGEVIDRACAMLHRASETAVRSVWLDEQTAGLLPGQFDTRNRGEHYELAGERDDLWLRRTLLGRPTSFVGRTEEVARLGRLLGEAAARRPSRPAIVVGPPGFGKSRLLSEVVSRLDDGTFEVWLARADSLGSGASLALARKLVERGVGLASGLAPARAQERLIARAQALFDASEADRVATFLGELAGLPFEDRERPSLRAARRDAHLMASHMERAFVDWLGAEASARPLLLVLEDLHWADRSSVRLILRAHERVERDGFAILGAARPEGHSLLTELAERIEIVELPPLSAESSRALARQALGERPDADVDALVERAQGNVFYLEELVRSLSSGNAHSPPETVLAMAQARLLGIEPAARRVLRAASVFGDSFWIEGVAQMLGHEPLLERRFADLERDEIIQRRALSRFAGSSEYRFRHALLREAAYASLTDLDRAVAHAVAARWLSRSGEQDAVVLAHHFAESGQLETAAGFYRAAAQQALRGNDLEATIELAQKGIEAGASGAVLGSLHSIAGEAYSWRGQNVEAERCGSVALPLLERGGAEWCWSAGATFMLKTQLGDIAGAMAVVQELAVTTPEPEAVSEYVKGSSLAIVFLCYAELYDVARGFLSRIAAYADDELDLGAAAWREFAHAYVATFCDGSPIGHLQHAERGAEFVRRSGDVRGQAMFDVEEGLARTRLGDVHRAETVLRRALDRAERAGLGLVAGTAELQLATALARQQRLDEAGALDCAAAKRFEEQHNMVFVGLARAHHAMVLKAMGRLDEAVTEAEQALELFAMAPTFRSMGNAALADALLAKGEVGRALEVAEAASAQLSVGGSSEADSYVRLVHVKALRAAGRMDEFRSAVTRARAILVTRAEAIADPGLRKCFLERVSENVETLELASGLG